MRSIAVAIVFFAACGTADLGEPGDADVQTETLTPETIEDSTTVPDVVDVHDSVAIDVSPDPNWRVALAPQAESFLGIWGSDPTDVWLVGDGGLAVHGGPGGWRQLDLRQVDGSGAALRGVYGADGDAVWMVGDEGRAYRYVRTQGRADVIYTGTTARLNAVWGIGSDVWAVGGPANPDDAGGPVILKLDPYAGLPDGLPNALPGEGALTDVWGTSATDVWAVGERGMVLHFDGSAWASVAVADAPWLRGVFVHAGEVVAVGDHGGAATLLVRAAGSETFERAPIAAPYPLDAVALAAGTGWAVGTNGQMFERVADSWEARAPFEGATWNDVWIDARGDVWVAGQGVARRGPDRGDIATGSLVRLEEPVADPDPDVEIVETTEVIDWDTTTSNPTSFQLGTAEPTNPSVFNSWHTDQTVLIQHGPQGGFHLEVYVRFPFGGTASEVNTSIRLELWVDGVRQGFFDTPSYPVPAQSDGIYQTYPMTLPWDCSLSFTCQSTSFDGKTAVVVATVGPPGQSWTGSVRVVLDDTW